MASYDMKREKERLDKVRDADFIAAWRVADIADWMQALGWCAVIIGVLVAIGTKGDPNAWAAAIGGFSAVIAARFVRAFAVLVENSAQTKRFNWQMLVELRRMQQNQDDQQPEITDEQRVEDVFDKYKAE